jgi:DNA polymerase-3 subunit beta
VLSRAELKGALSRLAAAAEKDLPLIALVWSAAAPLEIYLVRQPADGIDVIEADTKGRARCAVSLRLLAAMVEEIKGEHIEIMGTSPIRIRATDDVRKFALVAHCTWNFSDSS